MPLSSRRLESVAICALILCVWNLIVWNLINSVSACRLSVSGIHCYLVASFSGLTA
jgi:hypothetical protein